MKIPCKHKETGINGHIVNEMPMYNPPQWGIQWINNDEFKKFIKTGSLYYWNDKDKIELTNP